MLIAPKFSSRLSQVVGSRRAVLENEFLVGLDRLDKLGERYVQFLRAFLGRVLELGDGLGLSDLDRGTFVARFAPIGG